MSKPILDPTAAEFDADKANEWIARELIGYMSCNERLAQLLKKGTPYIRTEEWINIETEDIFDLPDFYHRDLRGILEDKLWEECRLMGCEVIIRITEFSQIIITVQKWQGDLRNWNTVIRITHNESLNVALIMALAKLKEVEDDD